MAIAFTNTSGTGYRFASNGSGDGSTDVPALANPSDIGSGKLLLGLWAGTDNAGAMVACAPVWPNISNEVNVTGSLTTLSSFDIDMRVLYSLLASTPTNCNYDEANNSNRRNIGAVLVITGHDATTPVSQTATGNGTGTTVTFPDTASVNDGDMVLRWCVIGKDDESLSFSGFTGATTVISSPQSGLFRSGWFLGYDIKSGNGAPGTKALTLSASKNWKAYTVIVAVAGGGADTSLRFSSGFNKRRSYRPRPYAPGNTR
jgi:hypothetical protein